MSVKEQIKIALIKKDMSLTDLHKLLKERYNIETSLQNLSSKINRNSLKYVECEQIADVLDCKIKWIDKEAE